jgi:hypothetical protein
VQKSKGGDITLGDIQNGRDIEKIEILHMRESVHPVVAVTPAKLERIADDKRYIDSAAFTRSEREELERAIRATTAINGELSDLRWGVVFFNSQGERIVSIYFNAGGGKGYVVNGAPVYSWSADLDRYNYIVNAISVSFSNRGLYEWVSKIIPDRSILEEEEELSKNSEVVEKNRVRKNADSQQSAGSQGISEWRIRDAPRFNEVK